MRTKEMNGQETPSPDRVLSCDRVADQMLPTRGYVAGSGHFTQR